MEKELTAAERFKQLGDELRAEGRIFDCPKCGHERDAGLCLECNEEICPLCETLHTADSYCPKGCDTF